MIYRDQAHGQKTAVHGKTRTLPGCARLILTSVLWSALFTSAHADDFSQNAIKGWNVKFPLPSHRIDPDPGGFRSKLADNGFGYTGYLLNQNDYDMIHHSPSAKGPQSYAGQKFTHTTYGYAYGTYDLSRQGIPGGQLVLGAVGDYTNWQPGGPTRTGGLSIMSYRQTLFDDALEIKLGYLGNAVNYIGFFVGGSVSGGVLGVNAAIPAELGISSTTTPRPGINIKTNFGKGFYGKYGIQRSSNPDGAQAEYDANSYGIGWSGDHVGALYLGELGYENTSKPDDPYTWIRAGYLGNTSDFKSNRNPGERSDDNYMAYLLADHQIMQLGKNAATAYRGWYAGATVEYASADTNQVDRDYELRLYAKGLFPSRPTDMLSFVAQRQHFSQYLVGQARQFGQRAYHAANNFTASYDTEILRGVRLSTGVTYVDRPEPIVGTRGYGNGVIGHLNLTVFY